MNNVLTSELELQRQNCIYTPCYCEENIWKLCEKIKGINVDLLDDFNVVFVSNEIKQVPIWCQISGDEKRDFLSVWDYHAFLIKKCVYGSQVYDFDTLLDFPSPFYVYVQNALRPELNLHEYERLFRVISSKIYLMRFASDRSHMKKSDGTYIRKPPSYPPIFIEGCTNNLDEFLCMRPGTGYGEVLDLDHLQQYFG